MQTLASRALPPSSPGRTAARVDRKRPEVGGGGGSSGAQVSNLSPRFAQLCASSKRMIQCFPNANRTHGRYGLPSRRPAFSVLLLAQDVGQPLLSQPRRRPSSVWAACKLDFTRARSQLRNTTRVSNPLGPAYLEASIVRARLSRLACCAILVHECANKPLSVRVSAENWRTTSWNSHLGPRAGERPLPACLGIKFK